MCVRSTCFDALIQTCTVNIWIKKPQRESSDSIVLKLLYHGLLWLHHSSCDGENWRTQNDRNKTDSFSSLN